MTSALGNIKVLDVTGWGPACIGTMMMADMGAQVLKVDLPPGGGRRGVGEGVPLYQKTKEEAERTAPFVTMNRGKKSLSLNLRIEAGQKIFHRLASQYDVIVESFRPGVMERMNVGYEAISKTNPRIVYCSVSGYGQTGPYRNLPGHDGNYTGMSGVLGLVGLSENDPPVCPLNLAADIGGAVLQSVIGIMFALWAREQTGHGQHVDLSMMDASMWMLHAVPGATTFFQRGTPARRGNTLTSGTSPYYNVYKTRDNKYLTICCIEPQFWENLCRAIGREDLIPQEFAPSPRKEQVIKELRQIFLTRTRDEWFDLLSKADVMAGKVLDMEELASDPQVQQRQMVLDREHPKSGKVRQLGVAVKLSDTPGEVKGFAPVLGEHTNEVLKGLGYPQQEIDSLREEGVVY